MKPRKSFTPKQRKTVYEKTGGRCAYCGEPIAIKQMQVDHIVPYQFGEHVEGCDVNDIENLLPACRPCNYIKSSMSIERFRIYVEGIPATLGRDSVTYRNAVRFGMIADLKRPCIFYFETLGISVPKYKHDLDSMYREQHDKIWNNAPTGAESEADHAE